jgi:hypothetical protein
MMGKCQGCDKDKNLNIYLISSGKYLDVALYCKACSMDDAADFKIEEVTNYKLKE